MPPICALLAASLFLSLPCRADSRLPNSETLIRLSVAVAAAPPALRYQLLPELKEMNPGNPIQDYIKCFMEQQKFFFDKEAFERREKLLAMPLKELPAQELRGLRRFRAAAGRLGGAARQSRLADPAEAQDRRHLPAAPGRAADARRWPMPSRFDSAPRSPSGRFDDAIRTAKTMFAMSRHLGEHPTLVGNLVGIAIANVAIGPLEEMLEQPGCPNLYWALTNLPSPLVSLEKGMEGERAYGLPEFRELDERAPMSADQIEKFVAHMRR